MTPIEERILALASGQDINRSERRKISRLAELLEDREGLLEIAVQEGIACLLYKNLKESGGLKAFDDNQRRKLETLYHRTVFFNLRLIHDLKEVIARFNQTGIQIVLLQGIILLEMLYRDVGLRPFTDLDIWVLPGDFPELVYILEEMGYQRDSLYPHTFKRGMTVFDIHTHLLGADRIGARRFILSRDQAYIYEQTRIMDFEGFKALCLGPYDQIIYLGLHALKHNAERLIWLADIKGLLAGWGEADIQALAERAGELGQEKSFLYILFLLSRLLGFHPPLPRELSPLHTQLHPLEKRLLKTRRIGSTLPQWAPLFLFSPHKGLHRRLWYIMETLFPNPRVLRQVFPHPPGQNVWRLYLKRLIQLSGKLVASVKRRPPEGPKDIPYA